MDTLTLLADGRETILEGRRAEAGWQVTAASLEAATGWGLKPEGLCRGDVCVPVRDRSGFDPGAVDLAAFAQALRRPVVLDPDEGIAALGEPRRPGAEGEGSPPAPDFTLPTVDGEPFTLSAVGRKKKVLLAWASW